MELRNGKTGEVFTSKYNHKEATQLFFERFASKDSWLWFWIHKAVAESEKQTVGLAMEFLQDSFVLAIGNGLHKPMIRLAYKNQRFKIYLSGRGTMCLKTGLINVTKDAAGNVVKVDPVGDEMYIGCILRGNFLPVKNDLGKVRLLNEVEKGFMDGLADNPIEFMAQCSKDMGRCCYCNMPLEDPQSKKVGYGPICARRWGLPWGNKKYKEKVPSFASEYGPEAHGICLNIMREPDNVINWEVFGDWLEDKGLPRVTKPKGEITFPRND